MRIIHCADLHLDSKMQTHFNKEDAKLRNAELVNTFVRMVEYADNNDVSGIIIAGDIFDTDNVSRTTKNIIRSEIEKHPDITFFYLKGNHEKGGSQGIEICFDELPSNVALFDDEWTGYLFGEKVTINGIEITEDNYQTLYDDLYLEGGYINIVVLHGQIIEKNTNNIILSKKQLKSVRTEEIYLNSLKYKYIDYLALGHVHSYKMDELDDRGIYCYSGCLEARGFDECGSHGFVLLDINENKPTDNIKATFIPFAYRNYHDIKVDVTGADDTAAMIDKVKMILDMNKIPSKDIVRVTLLGELDILVDKNIEAIHKSFEDMYHLTKVSDETVFSVDYRRYMHDESLKGEFVRTVLADESISEEEKAEILRCGILALTNEGVAL